MPRLGKEFEELVTRIEKALVGGLAIVKSPDYIPDKDTGQPREVDASVYATLGSAQLLMILECRKRKRESDVRWIEQLISKQESLNASKMIAVTSKPLTGPAIEKAARHGIDIRSVSETSAEALRGWFTVSDVQVDKYTLGYLKCYMRLAEDSQFDADTRRQVIQYLQSFGQNAPFIRRKSDGKMQSLDDLWKNASHEDLMRSIPVNGEYVECNQEVHPHPDHQLFVDTPLGSFTVQVVCYRAYARVVRERLPVARAAQYSDASHALFNAVEYDMEVNGNTETLTVVHDISTGKVTHSETFESIPVDVRLIERKPPTK